MAKIVVHRGEQRRKLTKKKKEMLKKQSLSDLHLQRECWIILRIFLCD